MQDLRRVPVRFAAPLAVSAFLAANAAPAHAQFKPCPGGTGSNIPCLNIDIPTVRLTGATRIEGTSVDTITVPFLAQYISGIYQYGLYAAVTVAGVMAVIGGFQWLTAGDSGRVSEAKERIQNAVIGVVLALGAFTILNTIDPRITKLSGLTIDVVKRQDLDQELLTTTADTAEGTDSPTAAPRSPNFSSCPITLTKPDFGDKPNFERVTEFSQLIGPKITATTPSDRILQVADAAAACGVNMGACGLSVGTIKTIAGVADQSVCTKEIKFSCWGKEVNKLDPALFKQVKDLRCPSKGPQPEGCVTDAKEATRKGYELIKSKNVPNWPDGWVDTLMPGDTVVVFNGNASGTHSVIFTGLSADGKSIMVVHGSYARQVKAGSICVKSTCAAPTAIVRVFR